MMAGDFGRVDPINWPKLMEKQNTCKKNPTIKKNTKKLGVIRVILRSKEQKQQSKGNGKEPS